jgi:hypothetical protein
VSWSASAARKRHLSDRLIGRLAPWKAACSDLNFICDKHHAISQESGRVQCFSEANATSLSIVQEALRLFLDHGLS